MLTTRVMNTGNIRHRGRPRAKLGALAVGTLGLAGLAGTTAVAAPAEAASSTGVRIGYFPNITHAPALVGVQAGIFAKDLGPDKLATPQIFSAGPAENQAVLAGSVDIAFEGASSIVSAYKASHAVTIIAGAASGGAGLVTKSSINSPSQLKGQDLGSPQLANTQDIALRYWLKTKGYQTTSTGGGDVHVLPSATGNGTIVTEFKAGKLAGAWMPQPYEAEMVADGGHVLVNEATLWPGGKWATTNVVVRTAFLKAHPATVSRFLKGLVDTLSYMKAHPAASMAAANKQLGTLQGGKPLKSSVLKTSWSAIDFTADPIASSLPKLVAHGEAVGLLKNPGSLKGIYTLGPLNTVLKSEGQATVPNL
jgi:sulfonate transport system substrate-binding protein